MNGRQGLVIAAVAALVVGFSLGLVAGIAFMRFGPPAHAPFAFGHGDRGGLSGEGRMAGPGIGFMGPGRRMSPGPMLRQLSRALDLSDAQRERIHVILMKSHGEQAAMRDSTHAAIERELTPAQRARWREMELRFQQTWRGHPGHPLPDQGRPSGGDPEPGDDR